MKSKFFILGCTALMVAGIFYSCRKDNTAPTENAQIVETSDINNLLLHFNQEFENFKSGKLLKSGVKIDKDSVIWYIDAAINFNYASGIYSFERLHRDTVYVEVQLDSEMKALLTDVFESYDKSQIRVGEKYYATAGENKKFVMATVSDAGSIAGGKRKLSIATLTGTGEAVISEDFGDDENYNFRKGAMWNCNGEPASGAPEVFEIKLFQHFEPNPSNGCRYFFFGSESILTIDYKAHQLSNPLTNYLDYKVFAASDNVKVITDATECLEYNQDNMGIHKMQFYLDHLIDFVDDWLSQPGNTGFNRKWFSGSDIKSDDKPNGSQIREICHKPKLLFRKMGYVCEESTPYFPTE